MAVNLHPARDLLPVAGIRLGVARAGIRHADRDDLLLIEAASGTTSAAVFTRNAFCAAPVIVARRHREATEPRFLLVNSGNANAGNGSAGVEDAVRSCRAVATLGGCPPEAVLPFSTGVIGQPLPVDRIETVLPRALADLSQDGWARAARAIMTTDTVPKGLSVQRVLAEGRLTVTGIAKGAGMICPDMATMLAFLATDARVPRDLLQRCLEESVQASFNRITVDGDTSTNDACILLATGAANAATVEQPSGPLYAALRDAVAEVCGHLAQAIVRDAEGATKLITVVVEEGANEAECLAVAYAVAHSPLVKTAFFASDPNWGRILAAVGRARVDGLAIERVRIDLNGVTIVAGGARAPGYSEALGQAAMREPEVVVRVALGRGSSTATVWTSDLSYEYVRINAEYRT